MTQDWVSRLPQEEFGMKVQPYARTDIPAPPGYSDATPLLDPFEAYAFTSFRRQNPDGTFSFALPLDARHENGAGVVHGGLLMSFADSTLGFAAWSACDPGAWCVTVSQSTSFLRAAHVGQVIETTPIVTRSTRTMVFTRADYFVGEDIIFTASSVWKVVGLKPAA